MLKCVILLAILLAVPLACVAARYPKTVVDDSALHWWYLAQSGTGNLTIFPSYPGSRYTILADAKYNESNEDYGWDYLRVGARINGEEGFYCAGYLEGALTQRRLSMLNFSAPFEFGPKALVWVDKHIAYMQTMAKAKSGDPFWQQVGNLLAQIRGIADGYNTHCTSPGHRNVSFAEMFYVSFGMEFMDVMMVVQPELHSTVRREGSLPKQRSHCSAFVKVTLDDLLVSHATWGPFKYMASRIYKVYNFPSISVVSFSGYPGSIASGDDWYITSNQLAIQETTNDIYNYSIYSNVVPATVSEFVRVMVANYLAHDGETWTQLFSRHNSGTSNNQYMVVDFKKYVPGSTITPGTLWIAEQIPGWIERRDMSDVLQRDGYWASYNLPHFTLIYNISGYPSVEAKYGSFFSYTNTSRANIFRRDVHKVVDVDTAMSLIRYNNFKNDRFSLITNCSTAKDGICSPPFSAMLSIAARGDLMSIYPTKKEMELHYGPLYDSMASPCFGAYDGKLAAWSRRFTLNAWAISGPTYDQQPPFMWDPVACPKPKGAVGNMVFPWIEFVNTTSRFI